MERSTSTPAPPLPPPDATFVDSDLQRQRLRTLAILAAIGITAAIVMALLWMSARSSRDDITAERDAAIAERDANIDSRQDVSAALISTQSDLNDATTANADLEADLEAARTEIAALEADASAEPVVDTERVDALEQEVADLEVRNQALADEIAELQAELDAQTEGPTEPTAFDATSTPEFARWVGETLSSRSGSSRLAQSQSECFGAAIVNSIGLDALGQGLNLAASSAANNVVVGAMQNAADFCNIPRNLIF